MAAWSNLIGSVCVVAVVACLAGCDAAGAGSQVAGASVTDGTQPEFTDVRIAGERFRLELALDDDSRFQGLSGRLEIPRDGGMLFVFPDVQLRAFVMRDCPNPIDIAYLDGSGRVVAIHTMLAEPPRGEGEKSADYERRLKGYSSRFGAQFVVETAGSRLRELDVKTGDQILFDVDALKTRAR